MRQALEDGTLKYKFPEKTAAREQAMKHFGLYERDNKQKPFYMPPEFIFVGVPGVVSDGGHDAQARGARTNSSALRKWSVSVRASKIAPMLGAQ